jgi:hypothetical protein
MAANQSNALLGTTAYQIQTNLYNVIGLTVTTTLLITPLHSVASKSNLASVFQNSDDCGFFLRLQELPSIIAYNRL